MKIDSRNSTLEAFGKKLRERREYFGVSQRYLAEKAGTTQAAVARIEAGLGNPTLDKLERMANVLNVDLNLRFFYFAIQVEEVKYDFGLQKGPI